MLNVDFEDNGNDEYGLVFSRDSEYDPLPSFQFKTVGKCSSACRMMTCRNR
jgi:hypothetical protein